MWFTRPCSPNYSDRSIGTLSNWPNLRSPDRLRRHSEKIHLCHYLANDVAFFFPLSLLGGTFMYRRHILDMLSRGWVIVCRKTMENLKCWGSLPLSYAWMLTVCRQIVHVWNNEKNRPQRHQQHQGMLARLDIVPPYQYQHQTNKALRIAFNHCLKVFTCSPKETVLDSALILMLTYWRSPLSLLPP